MAKKRPAPSKRGTYFVSTTMRPDEVIEVGPAELTDFEREGIVDKYHGPDTKAAASSERRDSGVITNPVDVDLEDEEDDDDEDDDEGNLEEGGQ